MNTPKFVQTESLYENNEYPNMPSIGRWGSAKRLTTKTKENIDWAIVDQIVKKYGLKYCLIKQTFACYGERGVYEIDFVLYFKTDIDNDKLQQKNKEGDYSLHREGLNRYKEISQKMHDCIHELDEQTALEFDTAWSGNVGLFGSHDVERQSYSGGSSLYDWGYITNHWSPSIHNTNMVLKKGVYIMIETKYVKADGVDK